MIIRHGVASLSDRSLWGTQFWLASYDAKNPAYLILNNSAAQVNTSGIPEDGVQGSIGTRYSDIISTGQSVVYLATGGTRYGGTVLGVNVTPGSNLMMQASLAGNTDMTVHGTGTLTNLGTTMYAAEADVIPAVAGTGQWSLAGNARLEFHHEVGNGQTVNLRGMNSTLQLDHADTFLGMVTTDAWMGKIILDGIEADRATYISDMLTISNDGVNTMNIRLDANSDFEVFDTPTGAVVMAGLYNTPEPGLTALLSHTA